MKSLSPLTFHKLLPKGWTDGSAHKVFVQPWERWFSLQNRWKKSGMTVSFESSSGKGKQAYSWGLMTHQPTQTEEFSARRESLSQSEEQQPRLRSGLHIHTRATASVHTHEQIYARIFLSFKIYLYICACVCDVHMRARFCWGRKPWTLHPHLQSRSYR